MKKRMTNGAKGWVRRGWSPVKNWSRVMKLLYDLPIFCPLMVIMLLCIQYFTAWCPMEACAWAISHSWCGKTRSMPPPCMSNSSPRYFLPMAVHSQCHPGKPSLHGDGQRMICSGCAFFHRAKSAWFFFSPTPARVSRLASLTLSSERPERMPYL